MSHYYYLITGLPDLSLEDTKLGYTVADFKTEFYPSLSPGDKKLVDLYYLQFDNVNVLKLLKDRETVVDSRGVFSSEELAESIALLKEGGDSSASVLPSYLSAFIVDNLQADVTDAVLPEDRLAALYYSYAMNCVNRFVASWFEFNLTVNNVLAALTARKYKMDVAAHVVGDSPVCDALRTSNARDFGLGTEVDCWEELLKISETEELLEREKKIDRLRWEWMDEHTFFYPFTVERLFVFLVRLGIIERWIALDKEKGNQMFRSIIAALKDEVQIPAEFR